MTSIHHATQKRADAEGIALSVDDGIIIAQTGETTFRHASAKTALDTAILGRTLAAEYPAIRLHQTEDGLALIGKPDEDPITGWPDGVVPDLADVLDAAIETGIDPEEGADNEAEAGTVVVATLYKQRYAAGGHPEHCGDWLAYQLEGAFSIASATPKGNPTFDTETFTTCLTDNGIELVGKWAALPLSGQPGWQGRYRMNGRQKLERQVASCGELVLHGETIPVPAEALDVLRAKHPKAYQPEPTAGLPEETIAEAVAEATA